MVEMNTIVGFEEGLRARPASVLAGLCKNAKSDIKILKETKEVNPKSIKWSLMHRNFIT